MNATRIADPARRRELLIERIAIERSMIARRSAALVLPARLIERGIDGARWVRGHPVATGAAVAVLVVLRGRRVLSWIRRGFIIWRTGRTLFSLVTGR